MRIFWEDNNYGHVQICSLLELQRVYHTTV